jgi:hypothetical protein
MCELRLLLGLRPRVNDKFIIIIRCYVGAYHGRMRESSRENVTATGGICEIKKIYSSRSIDMLPIPTRGRFHWASPLHYYLTELYRSAPWVEIDMLHGYSYKQNRAGKF